MWGMRINGQNNSPPGNGGKGETEWITSKNYQKLMGGQ